MNFFMQNNNQQHEHVYFVNQLYRDFLLPTILGKDNDVILYWGGKRIARKYDLASFEDVASFFTTTEFGNIEKARARHSEKIFKLTGQNVADRISSGNQEFSLEAGIIAEAVEKETGRTTECEIKVDEHKKIVKLIAKFD